MYLKPVISNSQLSWIKIIFSLFQTHATGHMYSWHVKLFQVPFQEIRTVGFNCVIKFITSNFIHLDKPFPKTYQKMYKYNHALMVADSHSSLRTLEWFCYVSSIDQQVTLLSSTIWIYRSTVWNLSLLNNPVEIGFLFSLWNWIV